MYHTKAYSAASATSPLASTKINRRDPIERDVKYRFSMDMASLKSE
jgi:alcohol dehydrogenase (NADP+)